jgi:hypothetical protein
VAVLVGFEQHGCGLYEEHVGSGWFTTLLLLPQQQWPALASTQQHQQQGGLSETANGEAAHASLIKTGIEASGRLQGTLGIPWGQQARQQTPARPAGEVGREAVLNGPLLL